MIVESKFAPILRQRFLIEFRRYDQPLPLSRWARVRRSLSRFVQRWV